MTTQSDSDVGTVHTALQQVGGSCTAESLTELRRKLGLNDMPLKTLEVNIRTMSVGGRLVCKLEPTNVFVKLTP